MEDEVKICIRCGCRIEYLADFPGPRCLTCHADKVDAEPLARPNFIAAVRPNRMGMRFRKVTSRGLIR